MIIKSCKIKRQPPTKREILMMADNQYMIRVMGMLTINHQLGPAAMWTNWMFFIKTCPSITKHAFQFSPSHHTLPQGKPCGWSLALPWWNQNFCAAPALNHTYVLALLLVNSIKKETNNHTIIPYQQRSNQPSLTIMNHQSEFSQCWPLLSIATAVLNSIDHTATNHLSWLLNLIHNYLTS